MKTLIFIIGIAIAACCSPKSINSSQETPATTQDTSAGLPACVQNLIRQFKSEEKQNPPRQIFSYLYNGKTVHYVTAPCCDFFSDLYDSNCNLVAHPDGGITGKGDGKAADFIQVRTNEKLIWKDERK